MAGAWAPGQWPIAIKTGWIDAHRRELNLSRLDALEKKLVWGCFQRTRPKLAALLKDDTVQALCGMFGAEIILNLDDLTGDEADAGVNAKSG